MEIFLAILMIYYCFIFVMVGFPGTLAIGLCEEVFDFEECLSNRRDFFRCIFMYQYAVAILLDMYEINKVGIFIAEVLTTFSVWFLNIIVFIILVFLVILKGICYLFWLIFRKRDDEVDKI